MNPDLSLPTKTRLPTSRHSMDVCLVSQRQRRMVAVLLVSPNIECFGNQCYCRIAYSMPWSPVRWRFPGRPQNPKSLLQSDLPSLDPRDRLLSTLSVFQDNYWYFKLYISQRTIWKFTGEQDVKLTHFLLWTDGNPLFWDRPSTSKAPCSCGKQWLGLGSLGARFYTKHLCCNFLWGQSVAKWLGIKKIVNLVWDQLKWVSSATCQTYATHFVDRCW